MKKEPYPNYKKHRKNNSKYYYHDRVPYGKKKDKVPAFIRLIGFLLGLVFGTIFYIIILGIMKLAC